MNTIRAALFVGLSIALPLAATTVAAQAQSSPQASNPPPAARQVPVYQPPLRGAPATRVGAPARANGTAS